MTTEQKVEGGERHECLSDECLAAAWRALAFKERAKLQASREETRRLREALEAIKLSAPFLAGVIDTALASPAPDRPGGE